jgi:hypothetical protein
MPPVIPPIKGILAPGALLAVFLKIITILYHNYIGFNYYN